MLGDDGLELGESTVEVVVDEQPHPQPGGGCGLLRGLLDSLGDALGGDDTSTPTYTRPGLLTAQLWFALPLLLV